MLNYSIQNLDNVKTLVISGSLTAETAESFKETVQSITQKESLIINVENVGLITSAGMNSLTDISFFAKEYGKRVIILWPSRDLLHMSETLGIYNYLIFAESIEEAKIKIKYFT